MELLYKHLSFSSFAILLILLTQLGPWFFAINITSYWWSWSFEILISFTLSLSLSVNRQHFHFPLLHSAFTPQLHATSTSFFQSIPFKLASLCGTFSNTHIFLCFYLFLIQLSNFPFIISVREVALLLLQLWLSTQTLIRQLAFDFFLWWLYFIKLTGTFELTKLIGFLYFLFFTVVIVSSLLSSESSQAILLLLEISHSFGNDSYST